MTRDQLFNALSALTAAQLHTVVYKLAVPRAILPGPPAPPAMLIIEVLHWAEQQGRLKDVVHVLAEVSAPTPATLALDPTPAPALRQGAGDGGIAQARTSTASDAAGAASAGRPMARNGAQPTPVYLNAEVQALSEQLERARQRKQSLRDAGIQTDEVDREILELRRKLRDGGQLHAGDALGDGRYLLVKQVGRGGFAVVWEAFDRAAERRVAIKVLHHHLASDPQRRERFFRGARVMMDLKHPAVVHVLDPRGEDESFCYFVMELVPGGNLREAVLSNRVAAVRRLTLILQVGEALAEAHRQRLVHRDIKPANILLDEHGNAKLTDFDLVGAHDTTGGTRTGALGTVVYAAPECLDRPQDATARADVFGLGMTAIFCLAGHDLSMDTLVDRAGALAQLDCTESVRETLERAVEWKQERRFADAAEMVGALRDALDGSLQSAVAGARTTVRMQRERILRALAEDVTADTASEDARAHMIEVEGKQVQLTATQFELIRSMVRAASQPRRNDFDVLTFNFDKAVRSFAGTADSPRPAVDESTEQTANAESQADVEALEFQTDVEVLEFQTDVVAGAPAGTAREDTDDPMREVEKQARSAVRASSVPATTGSPADPWSTNDDEVVLHVEERPGWAAVSGHDRYGVWAEFSVRGVRHRMRWIPLGTFLMGSPSTELGRRDDEGPRHEVTLSRGYWLGETPVTQALWVAVMGANPSRFRGKRPDDLERPVEQVSWEDCQRFLGLLNAQVAGLAARLPTEAEWERACRAGTTTATWVGQLSDEVDAPELNAIAWYGDNSSGETHPVGRKAPNPYGLHDTLGNVWEWCADAMRKYTAAPVTDPVGDAQDPRRVYRGGSWCDVAGYERAASRRASSRDTRLVYLGFRLAGGQSAPSKSRLSKKEPLNVDQAAPHAAARIVGEMVGDVDPGPGGATVAAPAAVAPIEVAPARVAAGESERSPRPDETASRGPVTTVRAANPVADRPTGDASSLSPEAVLSKIQSVYMAGLKRCYREYLKKDASARGKVKLSLTVNETGRVVKGAAHGFAPEVDECITSQMATWRFPIPKDKDGEATDASYEIALQLVPG